MSGPNQYTAIGQIDRTTSELEIAGAIRGRVATTNAVDTHQFQQHEFNGGGQYQEDTS